MELFEPREIFEELFGQSSDHGIGNLFRCQKARPDPEGGHIFSVFHSRVQSYGYHRLGVIGGLLEELVQVREGHESRFYRG